MVNELKALFPGLSGADYRITSPQDRKYNCIAWATGDTQRWWWPSTELDDEGYHWPLGVTSEETLSAFDAAFETLGYLLCDGAEFEPNWERIALYATADGSPTHAARQLANGRWTSKLGRLEDIEHGLRDLEGEIYGEVVRVMKRPYYG